MERNEFALAGAFALIVTMTLVIALVTAGSKFSDMAQWAQAVGTVGAIFVAIVMPMWERSRAKQREQDLAAMRVAAHLRAWLGPCASALNDLENYDSSNGDIGSNSLAIPPIDLSMTDVASVRLDRAKIVYSIVEQRSRAVDDLRRGSDVMDDDELAELFCKESAKLFRRVRNLYKRLAQDLGLHPHTCQQWELDTVNRAAKVGKVRNWKNLGRQVER